MRAGKALKKRHASDFRAESPVGCEVDLLVEEPLEIRVDGTPQAVVMRTPGLERELAAGFCLTEGLVESLEELSAIDYDPGGMPNRVSVTRLRQCAQTAWNPSGARLSGVGILESICRTARPLRNGGRFDPASLALAGKRLSEAQPIFQRSFASHAAALVGADGEFLAICEDVMGQNALDKAIGTGFLACCDLSQTMALVTGRVSFETVRKAACARIPVVAGISAATSLAVELADLLNCTLAGRLKGEEMTVYTCEERLKSRERLDIH